jgi:D-beta-D-heptose 7-phosphate kinase/D-beta-D-heptose 1-phosphate adenosyltransferase
MNVFQDQLAEFFQRISTLKQVCVLGDYFLDQYQIGEVERVSPEAPVPILKHLREEYRPGGAGNVVQNLSNLGIATHCFGVIGQDPEAKRLLSLLADKLSANTRYLVPHPSRPTSLKTRLIARGQQLLRVDKEDSKTIEENHSTHLYATLYQVLPKTDLLLVSDYDKGVVTFEATATLRKQFPKLWISVDPKGNDYRKYLGADLITPNESEAEQATGLTIRSEQDVIRCLHKLYEITQIPYICMTRSEKGMILFQGKTGKLTVQNAWSQREVYDVTGAGDTVLVFVSLGLARGIEPQTTLKIASLAAFLVIQKFGASGISMHEMVQGVSSPAPLTTLAKGFGGEAPNPAR